MFRGGKGGDKGGRGSRAGIWDWSVVRDGKVDV